MISKSKESLKETFGNIGYALAFVAITLFVVWLYNFLYPAKPQIIEREITVEVDSSAIAKEWNKKLKPIFESKKDTVYKFVARTEAETDDGIVHVDIQLLSPTPIDTNSYFITGLKYKELTINKSTTIIRHEEMSFWDRFNADIELSYQQNFFEQARVFNASLNGSFSFNYFDIFASAGVQLGYDKSDLTAGIGVIISL